MVKTYMIVYLIPPVVLFADKLSSGRFDHFLILFFISIGFYGHFFEQPVFTKF